MVNRIVTTVDEARTLIGQDLGAGPWTEITQERIDRYADVSGDHQWIHVDPERARNTDFGGTIAHGFLTLAMASSLLEDHEGVDIQLPKKMSINYGMNRLRFPNPVRVGKRIRARSRLLGLDEIQPGIVQETREVTVEVEGEPKPALVAETLTRHYLA